MKPRTWLALALLQATLVIVYVAVTQTRAPEAPFPVEQLDRPAPPLEGVDLGGGRVLVHFWATWCAPCRTELPGLLEATRETGIPLVAVTDESPDEVASFFPQSTVPAEVLYVSGAAAVWEVSGLPDTFVVERGRITGRMGGPRDWSTRAARSFLNER